MVVDTARAAVQRLSPAARVGIALLVATWGAQVVIPLTQRRALPTTAVVVLLAGSVAAFAADSYGGSRAAVAAGVVCALGLAAEVLGTRTGWPFGSYQYTGGLRPTLAGVPVVVVLAWFAMGLPAWEVAGRLAPAWPARVAVGAVALAAWDLFLDPQMVHDGFWRWPGGGWYRGIPLSNYAGWLGASAVVMLALAVVLPGRAHAPGLLAVYSLMAVMETIGFLFFFEDRVVAAVGGVVTLPLAAAAWRAGRRG